MNSNRLGNLRVYLWAALAMLLFYDYQVWVHDYAPPPAPPAVPSAAAPPGAPESSTDLGNRFPEAAPQGNKPAAPATQASAAVPGAQVPSGSPEASAAAPVVHVRTDVLDVDIGMRGGTLERVDLLAYPKVKGEAAPVRLENRDDAQSLYELQSGLTGPEGSAYPTHLATFASSQSNYALDGGNVLTVPLTWSEGGVTVTKSFVFHRGQYRIDLDYAVRNGGASPWSARQYAQILRNDPPTKRSMFNVESYAFHGPALWDGGKFRRLDTTDSQDSRFSLDVHDGWVAALQHHFVSAIVPPRGGAWHFGLGVQGQQYLLTATGPEQTVAAGASGQFEVTLFTGPKLQGQLEATSPELGHVADYGRLWFLARPLYVALSWVHKATGNWGVAIIVVTFLLKLLFYPLSEASGRSMAKMKTLQPRIKNLQETYADAREKLGRAMMELYKREKINPVAGCLPIVIQIPVFLAFYWVLLESVEMRQAPFAFFPAGLVLYWVTNTILSIAQQWNINRRIGAQSAQKN